MHHMYYMYVMYLGVTYSSNPWERSEANFAYFLNDIQIEIFMYFGLSYNFLVSGNTKHYYSSIVYKTEKKILSKKYFYVLCLPVPSFKFMENVFIRTRCSKPENLLLMPFWKVTNLFKNFSPAVILFHIPEYVTETHSQNCSTTHPLNFKYITMLEFKINLFIKI